MGFWEGGNGRLDVADCRRFLSGASAESPPVDRLLLALPERSFTAFAFGMASAVVSMAALESTESLKSLSESIDACEMTELRCLAIADVNEALDALEVVEVRTDGRCCNEARNEEEGGGKEATAVSKLRLSRCCETISRASACSRNLMVVRST